MRLIPCPQSGLVMQLARVDLYQGAAERTLELVAGESSLVEFAPQEVLMEENRPAEHFCAILRGRVKVVHRTRTGREHLIHVVTGPGLVGVAAMFRQRTHPATVVALDTTLAVRTQRGTINEAVRADAEFALRLLGVMSLRQRMFVKKLSNQGVSARRRVSRYLLHRVLIERCPAIELRVSREEMANMLGMARETLSRVFGSLVDGGIISVQGRKVTVQNLEMLRRLASMEKDREEERDDWDAL